MSATPVYLCYDLKGIQSFIFAVPRLRYICGGSAIIDRFDREIVPGYQLKDTRHLFSGGGKGAFVCDNKQAAEHLQARIVEAAHENGLGVNIGRHVKYSEAAQNADRNFPWLPDGDELEGHPCPASGLFPVQSDQPHHVITRRASDEYRRWFEEQLLCDISIPSFITNKGRISFLNDVDAVSGQDGKAGSEALGSRNRWAVIAMDGNDMGTQHRKALEIHRDHPGQLAEWIGEMSRALDTCSRTACRKAIEYVVRQWADTENGKRFIENAHQKNKDLVLPVRPLIVGGDDIVIICHVNHAMEFVKEACRVFETKSHELAEACREKKGYELWPATSGHITITAGILFAPVGLPLSTAIPYAESLLASAKREGRKHTRTNEPSPACIDWESVTEGVIETPTARRKRELMFRDPDIQAIVQLTCRPYTLDALTSLSKLAENYKEIPATIRHQVLPGLQCGYFDRQVFTARIAKNNKKLSCDLRENELDKKDIGGRWHAGELYVSGEKKDLRRTDVVDALLLLEEQGRMTKETA